MSSDRIAVVDLFVQIGGEGRSLSNPWSITIVNSRQTPVITSLIRAQT